MKTNIAIFGGLGVFCLLVAAVYAFLTAGDDQIGLEWVGFICLLLTGGLGLMLWWYLRSTAKHHEVLDGDNPQGEISDMHGNYGEFAPWSWWPLGLGFSAAFLFFGLAIDWWVFFIGLIPGLFFVTGWVMEFNRKRYAH
ncbi:aa3-type cytochrome oxidase subunit IV [Nesterenkonia flava]|uniref:Cytochrome c oxidase polypeptide 4 n=1 Tax=Nesterenkonia flava TaxID=469799 RepID=A0ABU1FPT3_9MICC|nr:cytochrome c oxidase subunit 4 [Nesterenkonia flava]MDR5710650.1 cytochrome c oxidase subunit 4 [Nesterenkonia flava]